MLYFKTSKEITRLEQTSQDVQCRVVTLLPYETVLVCSGSGAAQQHTISHKASVSEEFFDNNEIITFLELKNT